MLKSQQIATLQKCINRLHDELFKIHRCFWFSQHQYSNKKYNSNSFIRNTKQRICSCSDPKPVLFDEWEDSCLIVGIAKDKSTWKDEASIARNQHLKLMQKFLSSFCFEKSEDLQKKDSKQRVANFCQFFWSIEWTSL